MYWQLTVGCGHCKKLAPEYEEAAKALQIKDIHLADVDCTDPPAKSLCSKYEVHGYPAMKVFVSRVPQDYGGLRTANDIIGYMETLLTDPVSEIASGNVEEFLARKPVAILAFNFESDSPNAKVLNEVAATNRFKYSFGLTSDQELVKKYEIGKEPAIVMFKSFDDPQVKFTKPINAANLEDFIKKNSLPILDDINADNYQFYMQLNLPMAYIFYTSPEDRKSLIQEIHSVAKSHKGLVSFILIDSNKYASHAENLNLKGPFPGFVIHDLEKNLKYPFQGTIAQAAISAFVSDYVNHKLEPFFKSEPVPESNNEPVKVVVGTQFHEIVMDRTKDVLIEFYAPCN